ncbi:MAG: hypothetical protein R2788_13110 [Saprospiraceae bacterium]
MMRTSQILILLFTCITFTLPSQTEVPKWRFGIGAGVSSLRLHKGDFFNNINLVIAASEKRTEITRLGNHFSWQVNSTVSYYLGRHLRLQGGLGITKGQSRAYRKTIDEGYVFFIPFKTTTWDTVDQKYILLDIPLYIRWQMVEEDNPNLVFKFFMDVGFVAELPLVNQSSLRQKVSDGDYYSVKLKLTRKTFPFFGIGFMADDKISLVLSWTFISNSRYDVADTPFNSTLTRLTLNRYF